MKKTFTLVELMIVMAILGIMFLMTKNYFTSENQIYYQGEECINNFYYSIKDLSSAALLGRTRTLSGVFSSSGDNIQTPDRYTIILREPSFFTSPQFAINIEDASGLVKALHTDPANALSLGVYGGQTILSKNLDSWGYFYRGTGDITQTLDTTGAAYGIMYLPVWGINNNGVSQAIPVKGCANTDFFVTYTIPELYSGTTTLRIGFQNSSSLSNKKMIIQPGQWASGIFADLNTGAVNFQVCNRFVQCKETFRIFFDTRVNDMFLQKCSQYGTGKKCDVWQGGNIN